MCVDKSLTTIVEDIIVAPIFTSINKWNRTAYFLKMHQFLQIWDQFQIRKIVWNRLSKQDSKEVDYYYLFCLK